MLERVGSQTERMTLLVEDLLLLARLDAGRPLARERVDLARLVARRFRRAKRRRFDHPCGDQAGDCRPDERDPVGRAEPGMGMVRGEPALDGEEQTGEQREAAQRGNGANRNAKYRRRKSPERKRACDDRAHLAKEWGR